MLEGRLQPMPVGMTTCLLFPVGVGLVPQPVGPQTPEERQQERDEINRKPLSDTALQALAQRSRQRNAEEKLEKERRLAKRRRLCN